MPHWFQFPSSIILRKRSKNLPKEKFPKVGSKSLIPCPRRIPMLPGQKRMVRVTLVIKTTSVSMWSTVLFVAIKSRMPQCMIPKCWGHCWMSKTRGKRFGLIVPMVVNLLNRFYRFYNSSVTLMNEPTAIIHWLQNTKKIVESFLKSEQRSNTFLVTGLMRWQAS